MSTFNSKLMIAIAALAMVVMAGAAPAQQANTAAKATPPSAGDKTYTGAPGAGASPHATVSGNVANNLKLQNSLINRVSGEQSYGAGTVNLGGTNSITCPASPAGNCIIEATISVQVRGDRSFNRYYLCMMIDGTNVDPPGCPYVGLVPDFWETNSFTFAKYNVPPGNHQVRARLGSDEGISVANSVAVYHVYK